MGKENYYELLGVEKNASKDDIKRAYRKMAMKFHPDKNPGDKNSEDMFKKVAEAYDVLSDDTKKQQYDRFGSVGGDMNFGGGGFTDMNDIFSKFGDIFGGGFKGGNPFDDIFGGGFGGRHKKNKNGRDLRISIKLTLEEIESGVEKTIRLRKKLKCDICNGTGSKDGDVETCKSCGGVGYTVQMKRNMFGNTTVQTECHMCKGMGTIIKNPCTKCHSNGCIDGEEMVTLNIPAGVSNGMQLIMKDKGDAGIRGGGYGELIINVVELPHNIFIRDGFNIIMEKNLNVVDAIIGCDMVVPRLNNPDIKIKVPSGTQHGEYLKVRECGIINMNTKHKGDLYVKMNINIPKNISPEEVQLLNELKKYPNFK